MRVFTTHWGVKTVDAEEKRKKQREAREIHQVNARAYNVGRRQEN